MTVRATDYPVRMKMPLEERYWSKVEKTSTCWLWTSSVNTEGYGTFMLDGRAQKAHRVGWALANGRPAPRDKCVLHRCDQPLCVRPGHLFLGTKTDNYNDMMSKGRGVVLHGELNGLSKLTATKVRVMRFLRQETTLTLDVIGMLFGVTRSTAQKAATGRSWKSLGPMKGVIP